MKLTKSQTLLSQIRDTGNCAIMAIWRGCKSISPPPFLWAQSGVGGAGTVCRQSCRWFFVNGNRQCCRVVQTGTFLARQQLGEPPQAVSYGRLDSSPQEQEGGVCFQEGQKIPCPAGRVVVSEHGWSDSRVPPTPSCSVCNSPWSLGAHPCGCVACTAPRSMPQQQQPSSWDGPSMRSGKRTTRPTPQRPAWTLHQQQLQPSPAGSLCPRGRHLQVHLHGLMTWQCPASCTARNVLCPLLHTALQARQHCHTHLGME